MLFLGGRGAGGKANQGGLPALTVIGKLQLESGRRGLMGGKQILLFLGGRGLRVVFIQTG